MRHQGRPDEAIGVYHTVQAGQTLYSIAEAYGVDIQELKNHNRIDSGGNLQAGQRLWIPGVYRVVEVPVAEREPAAPGKKRKEEYRAESKPDPRARQYGLIWPVRGELSSRFGLRDGRKHDGIDVAAAYGAPINAAADGMVVFSGWGPTGYGLMVILRHADHYMTVYAHNSALHARKGMQVKQGQRIAAVGSTGRSTGPHLHFEIRRYAKAVDPLPYLPDNKPVPVKLETRR